VCFVHDNVLIWIIGVFSEMQHEPSRSSADCWQALNTAFCKEQTHGLGCRHVVLACHSLPVFLAFFSEFGQDMIQAHS